ncbi:iron ABC transporter permease [uncultured Methylophaga sp.]|uniref:FecCD family ABC transporter permease n=1 Tax=uncultured Methylophaga sp. TaxID=285271 RepID=UPI00261A3923|nr:iron ABC transporter permease [uncultured Methylophaga sp.]
MTLTTRLTLMVLFCLAVLALAPFAGLGGIDDAAIREQILTQIRFPRTLFAFVAGAGLALCGLVFQAMFHNPLATPFTLGVASGASFGAALTVLLGINISLLGFDAITLGAFFGALGAISFVYGISRLNYSFSTETLLLTGVATSFFFSSLILFTQYLSDVNESFRITRWLMGGLSISGYQQLLQLLPVVTLSAGIIIWLSRELNLLMAGDDIAISRGVAVKRVRYLMFFTTSMCVGAIVALCGPIGFVGMMVPHICRLIIGTDHRWLIPASLVFGGGFLILCDTLARVIIAPAELPVGVITTLLGGPFFLWLLVRSRRQSA